MSTRPLHVLCFLFPLIILYEIGSALYLTDPARGIVETVGARSILARFFESFGGAGLYLPGIALAVVLGLWHLFTRDRWIIRPGVLAGMFAESALWTLPLLVLGLLVFQSAPAAIIQDDSAQTISQLSWQARLTLSVGAGIYEELLFRLILVTLVHFVVVDLARLPQTAGYISAALASGLLFALYHNVVSPSGATDWRLFTFYSIAGVFFAVLYLLRGFGIVVACHALYDVLVLVALNRN